MFEFFGLDVFTWILIAGLGFALPLWAKVELRRMHVQLADGDPRARIQQYDSTMRWQWGMVTVLLGAWALLERSFADLGLVFAPSMAEWIAIGVSLLLGAVVVVLSLRAEQDDAQIEALGDQLGELGAFMPRGPVERHRFVWLSITAGVCEELIYRGVLMISLAAHIGLWPAAVVSSVVFGAGHAYQGATGMVRTGAVGLVFAAMVILTGSLWIPMLLHALLDISQGRLASRAAERKLVYA